MFKVIRREFAPGLELWKNQMKQYPEGKLRTYTTFKVHFGFENYLSVIGNFEHRRCLTKLKISAHRLHIETGRYQGKPSTPKVVWAVRLGRGRRLNSFSPLLQQI